METLKKLCVWKAGCLLVIFIHAAPANLQKEVKATRNKHAQIKLETE